MKAIDASVLATSMLLVLAACNNDPMEESRVDALTSITEFAPLPTANAAPTNIIKAQDGSLWFTEKGANKVARLTIAGVLTEYPVPTANGAPDQITAGVDGNVWFTERYGWKIGRISQAGGTIAEFALTNVGEYPTAITTDASGRIWFASNEQPGTARVGWISSTGTVTRLAVAASRTTITGIAAGADGNLWVTQVSSYWGDSIAKVTTSGFGSFHNYPLSNRSGSPQSITAGSDGNLWFTESAASKIGRITTAGVVAEFAVPTASSQPMGITAVAAGNLWFTEKSGNKIGEITVGGVITEYAVPTSSSQPSGITTGPDGGRYFTEQSGNRIGRAG